MAIPDQPRATPSTGTGTRLAAGSLTVRSLVLLGAAALSALFLVNLCDLVFACGCKAWWAGAASACNIHAPAPPHCPWCAAGWWGMILPLAAIVGAQSAALFWPGGASLLARTILAVAAFPAIGTVVAVAWGMVTGYWR